MSGWEYRQVLVEQPEQTTKRRWDLESARPWQEKDFLLAPEQLSSMGTEGWDLASAFPLSIEGTTLATVYIFKRPKQT